MNQVVSPNWLAALPPKERAEALQRITREVYSTPNGALVLSALLQDLNWTRDDIDGDKVVLRNFATYYLKERLGINLGHSATLALLNQREV
jgi:hypothetical protein